MLTLGISTSSSRFSIVFGENNKVLFNSDNPEFANTKTIETLVTKGLHHINRKVSEITNIVVDNGPGGTSSVRTGVAFANSLAYSLGIKVCPVSSFEILGFELYKSLQLPVLLTTKSIKENAFFGYFNNNKLQSLLFGKIDDIIANLALDDTEVIATGYYKKAIKDLLSNKIVHSSEIQHGNVEILIEKEQLFSSRAVGFPGYVIPITEKNLTYD